MTMSQAINVGMLGLILASCTDSPHNPKMVRSAAADKVVAASADQVISTGDSSTAPANADVSPASPAVPGDAADTPKAPETAAIDPADAINQKKVRLGEQVKYLLSHNKQNQESLAALKNQLPLSDGELQSDSDFTARLNAIGIEMAKDVPVISSALCEFAVLSTATADPAPACAALAPSVGSQPQDTIQNINTFLTGTVKLIITLLQQSSLSCAASAGQLGLAAPVVTLNSRQGASAVISNLERGFQAISLLDKCMPGVAGDHNDTHTVKVFDNVTFYDGAAKVSDLPPAEILRLDNGTTARQLAANEVSLLGSDLQINLTLKAACATYDNSGILALALVPKNSGKDTLSNKNIKRIELARIITPFLNKNNAPFAEPFSFSVGHLAKILRDPELNGRYDLWLELVLYNGTSDAQDKVAGCKGRYDTYQASVDLVSHSSFITDGQPMLQPLDYLTRLDSYTPGIPDEIGKTVRTLSFTLDKPLSDARFFLITTKHGPAAGGEEYIRRVHDIYLDGKLLKRYKAGGISCEPYRKFNTIWNGIYGSSPKGDWFNWSNWCPGGDVPIRQIAVGDLAAGTHAFKISLPDAVWPGQQGNVYLSVYLKGDIK